jgi:hypothetical protein
MSHTRLSGDTPRRVRERRTLPPYLRFVDPSSLVFAAIIGVWAAYLIPHWLRHRDQFIHSPDDDRNSDRLRVLSRREPVVSAPARSGGPVLTAPSIAAPDAAAPAAPRGRSRRPARPGRSAGQVAARRRARVLLLLVAATAAAWAGVALGAAAWVVGAALSGLLLIDVAALRAAAVRRAAARRHARAGASARLSATASRRRPTAPAQPVIASRSAAPAEREATADDRPGTWVPVPVPPPVYTLKPVAHRPEPQPLQPVERPAAVARDVRVPQPAAQLREPLPQMDLDAVLDRRRAVNL